MKRRTLAVAILVALPLIAHGSIYKWEDADGTTVYGENPPPEVDAVPVQGATGTPLGESDADDGEAASTGEEEAAPEDEHGGDADDAQVEVMAEQCDAARETVDVLSDPSVRRIREGDGETEVLTEERREERLDEAQEFLDEFC